MIFKLPLSIHPPIPVTHWVRRTDPCFIPTVPSVGGLFSFVRRPPEMCSSKANKSPGQGLSLNRSQ